MQRYFDFPKRLPERIAAPHFRSSRPCMCLIISNLRHKNMHVMCNPQVHNGLADVGMNAPSSQNNRLLTAYLWLAMFIGQIGIYVRNSGAFWLVVVPPRSTTQDTISRKGA